MITLFHLSILFAAISAYAQFDTAAVLGTVVDSSKLQIAGSSTTDSNIWGGASGHAYTFMRKPNGTTDIDVVVVRDGRNLRGRMLGFVLGTIGKRVLAKAYRNSVKAIQARNTRRIQKG